MPLSDLSRDCPSVALVEDDDCLAMLLRYNFEAIGCSVECFSRGDTALERLLKNPPNIVVLDWMLPGLAGIEVLRQLRRAPLTRATPVLMLTGRTSPECRADAMSMGADAFLTKPFTLSEVITRLCELLERTTSNKAVAYSEV